MSQALEDAKRSMRMATQEVTATARGTALVDDNPTGDPEVDARRAETIALLGRPLSPNEAFNVAAGLPHDFTPPRIGHFPIDTEMLHPEEALRRGA